MPLFVGMISAMTSVRQLPVRGRVPSDSFALRLAMVRADMGWNYDQAARATGINSETWRLWEKRQRQCGRLEETCRQIADVTGISFEWLMIGGAPDMTPAPPPPSGGAEADGSARPKGLEPLTSCSGAARVITLRPADVRRLAPAA